MKVCTKCNKDKPLTSYPALTRMAGGKSRTYYNKMCKACTSAHNKANRRAMAYKRAQQHQDKEITGIDPYFLTRGKISDAYMKLDFKA